MLSYTELYEYLRKEKFSEQLQNLPKNLVAQFGDFLKEKKKEFSSLDDTLSSEVMKEKKQFENAHSIFKELILRRKKKILNLVFIATETGIMKRDFADMLSFEKELFEDLISAINKGDDEMKALLNGKTKGAKDTHKMITLMENVEEFVDMDGNTIGPYKKGTLVNIDSTVADILISGGKASQIDE